MLPIPIMLSLRFRKFIKGKLVVSERNYPAHYPLNNQKSLKNNAWRADGWVFQTECAKSWYGEAIKDAKSVIIPNTVNLPFAFKTFEGSRKKTIVSAGRMVPEKNQLLLIRAFAKVHRNYGNFKLVIYGDGRLRNELEKELKRLNLTKDVSMPGFSTDWSKNSIDASLFVLSSDFEGMPNALMEAMALGLPCISTDCEGGGARYLIEDEKNGLLVSKNDVDALASAMERMLSDQDFAERCGHEAQKISERLAPEKIYCKWESFIKEVVGND